MKKSEAIALIDKALSQLTADRQTHIALQEAVRTIQADMEPKDLDKVDE